MRESFEAISTPAERYRVRLADFEGPLDLLLYFVQRDELDIYNIPISRITDEYLEYVRMIGDIDLDSAGEFIYMAALLISIKARMLLPGHEERPDEEVADPRRELVDRLLEYARFKEASGRLTLLAEDRALRIARNEVEEADDPHTDEPTYQVSLFQLLSALHRVVVRAQARAVHVLPSVSYSVEEQRRWLTETVPVKRPISFSELMKRRPKRFIIATFLAILEVVREGTIRILLGKDGSDFFLVARRRKITSSENDRG